MTRWQLTFFPPSQSVIRKNVNCHLEGHLDMDVEFLVTVAKSAPGLEL